MALDRITLTNFRNHAQTALKGTGQFNLLVGENGAGKTNVLEALSLLAPGRGLRRATLPDMALASGPGGFAVGASLTAQGPSSDNSIRLGTYTAAERPTRRMVRINEAETSAVALGEWLSVSWLTPAMDRLFMDSAGARRRFMDRMALALDPAHARYAARYENTLRERNRLLSDDAEPDPIWMDGIEAQMAEHGANLSQSRARLVGALQQELELVPSEPFARPALTYELGGPMEQAELAGQLRSTRARDRAARRSLTGPHRDELQVVMASKNAPAATCSTGEQKAMLIALTLAHSHLAASGRASLLLLDEVAAHLDPIRRDALFDRLRENGAQIWLTGTERLPFSGIANEAAIWQVSEGTLSRL